MTKSIIDTNILASNDYGISLFTSSSENTVSNNSITATTSGIALSGSNGNNISSNSVSGATYGLSIDSSSNLNIQVTVFCLMQGVLILLLAQQITV